MQAIGEVRRAWQTMPPLLFELLHTFSVLCRGIEERVANEVAVADFVQYLQHRGP